MDAKLTVFLVLLGLGCVAAQSQPDYWHGKGNWYGPTKPWYPPNNGYPVYSSLYLVENNLVSKVPPSSVGAVAGTPAVYWDTVTCGTGTNDVGSCSWTGLYIANVTSGAGLVDWQISCTITTPCSGYGVGQIIAIGRGDGVDGTATIDYAIVGECHSVVSILFVLNFFHRSTACLCSATERIDVARPGGVQCRPL